MSRALYFILASILLVACEDEGRRTYLPGNSGNQGELLVVAPETFWASDEANALRLGLAKLFPGLPADEPLFTYVEVNTSGFADIFKTHRNILEIKIDPTNKTNALKRKDVFAKQQLQVIVNLNKSSDITAFVDTQLEFLLQAFHQAEINRLASRNKAFGDKKLNQKVLEETGLSIIMQEDFRVAKSKENFLWLRLEREKPIGGFQHQINQGIMIYSRPYLDTAQFSDSSLVAWKNQINKTNIPGPSNSYMSVSDRFMLPVSAPISFRESAAKEIRGLWRMEGAKGVFMGGPFYGVTFYNEKDQQQYFVEGYVYGPQFNKRSFIREVEAIIKSVNPN